MTVHPVAKGSIARAARVLDALVLKPDGASLMEIVSLTKFTKTTTFRVLASLQDVNFVVQDPQSSRYSLGLKFMEMAQSATQTGIAALADRAMERLAGLSKDTVFLSIPEGAASVCVARKVGTFPIQTLTLNIGDRRPLGVGAGALALYCTLPPGERAAVNRVNRNWLSEYGFTEAFLETQCAVFPAKGYVINDGRVVPGMSAVAVPVMGQGGRPMAALAIGAISDRMDQQRVQTLLLPALGQEAEKLAERLDELGMGRQP